MPHRERRRCECLRRRDRMTRQRARSRELASCRLAHGPRVPHDCGSDTGRQRNQSRRSRVLRSTHPRPTATRRAHRDRSLRTRGNEGGPTRTQARLCSTGRSCLTPAQSTPERPWFPMGWTARGPCRRPSRHGERTVVVDPRPKLHRPTPHREPPVIVPSTHVRHLCDNTPRSLAGSATRASCVARPPRA